MKLEYKVKLNTNGILNTTEKAQSIIDEIVANLNKIPALDQNYGKPYEYGERKDLNISISINLS